MSTPTGPQGAEPPIRVKLYGLFPVTRRSYLTQLFLGAVLLVLLLVLWVYLQTLVPLDKSITLPPQAEQILTLSRRLIWLVPAIAVLFAIEACVVLRRFRQKEAMLRTKPPEPQPEPSALVKE